MEIGELVLTIVVVVGFTAILTFFAQKQKKSSWTGQLIKKRQSYDDETGRTTYKLIFKTDEGKKKRVQMKSKQEFDNWEEGENAIKVSGEYFPKKA